MQKNRIGNVLVKMILGLLLILGFNSLVFALESDAEQPIYIDSNSATYDDKKGVSIYIGKVVASQGSMVLYSDKLVVYLKDGVVDKLVGTGVPARFKQTPEDGKEDIKGKSLTLEYYPEQALLVLIDEAVVTQGTNTYASDLIKYNNITSIVMAGEKSSDTKRVRVILQPKKKNSGNNGQARSNSADQKVQ